MIVRGWSRQWPWHTSGKVTAGHQAPTNPPFTSPKYPSTAVLKRSICLYFPSDGFVRGHSRGQVNHPRIKAESEGRESPLLFYVSSRSSALRDTGTLKVIGEQLWTKPSSYYHHQFPTSASLYRRHSGRLTGQLWVTVYLRIRTFAYLGHKYRCQFLSSLPNPGGTWV